MNLPSTLHAVSKWCFCNCVGFSDNVRWCWALSRLSPAPADWMNVCMCCVGIKTCFYFLLRIFLFWFSIPFIFTFSPSTLNEWCYVMKWWTAGEGETEKNCKSSLEIFFFTRYYYYYQGMENARVWILWNARRWWLITMYFCTFAAMHSALRRTRVKSAGIRIFYTFLRSCQI